MSNAQHNTNDAQPIFGRTGVGMAFSQKIETINEVRKESSAAKIKADSSPRKNNNGLWLDK